MQSNKELKIQSVTNDPLLHLPREIFSVPSLGRRSTTDHPENRVDEAVGFAGDRVQRCA